jgi:hypothetical protein
VARWQLRDQTARRSPFGQPPIRIYVLQRLADTANNPEIQKFARRFG